MAPGEPCPVFCPWPSTPDRPRPSPQPQAAAPCPRWPGLEQPGTMALLLCVGHSLCVRPWECSREKNRALKDFAGAPHGRPSRKEHSFGVVRAPARGWNGQDRQEDTAAAGGAEQPGGWARGGREQGARGRLGWRQVRPPSPTFPAFS